jgi:hypothetical protein
MIVSNALVKVGHCQVNYNHSPRTKKLAGGFAFAETHLLLVNLNNFLAFSDGVQLVIVKMFTYR